MTARFGRLPAVLVAALFAACGGGGGGGGGDGEPGDDPGPGPDDVIEVAGDVAGDAPKPWDPGTQDVCTGASCPPNTCYNHKLNPDETDLDCGGVCPPCGWGKTCRTDDDCVTGACIHDECGVPSCTDGLLNGSETDLDCGGPCSPCALGKKCAASSDCASQACTDGACVTATCDDGRKNGGEADVDCGGPCEPCGPYKTCSKHDDCTTRFCKNAECIGCTSAAVCPGADSECRKRTCVGGVCGFENEPDGEQVPTQKKGDCIVVVCDGLGGSHNVADDADVPVDNNQCTEDECDAGVATNPFSIPGAPCAIGAGKVCNGKGACVDCVAGTDCPSGVCKNAKCAPASCTDKVRNGGETGIDCGGPCPGCPIGDPCNESGDCETGFCDGTKCVECLMAGDCPKPASTCTFRTCDDGACGTANVAPGAPATQQTAGDCKVVNCDGDGAAVAPVPEPADVPDDANPCTEDLCTAGAPSNDPVAAGTGCGEPGGPVCDGEGACVECLDAPCPTVLLLAGSAAQLVTGGFRAGKGWTVATASGGATSVSVGAWKDQVVGFAAAGGVPLRWTAWKDEAWSAFAEMGAAGAWKGAPALTPVTNKLHAVLHGAAMGYWLASWDGAAWTDAAAVGSPAVGGPTQAAAGASEKTGITVLFADASDGNRLKVTARAGGAWTAPVQIASDAIFSIPPAIAVTTGDADRLGAYVRNDGQVMYFRHGTVGWTAPAPVTGVTSAGAVSLAALPDGRAAIAWNGMDGRPFVAVLDGDAWGAVEAIAEAGVSAATRPSLSPGIGGADVEAVFLDATGRALHARRVAGDWTEPSQVGAASGLSCAAVATVF
ncbi:MAG: hypothetical protein FJ087_17800 [Deltaproteobacteria bacterium]|nr:hypothetical protein [Deltaproteobacteria bacterium]